MINSAAKVYFAGAVLALGAVLGYQALVGDRAGWMLMLFLLAAAIVSGLAVAGSGFPDRARSVADDAPIEHTTVGPVVAPHASPWPVVASIGVGLLALGLVLGTPYVVGGLAVAMLAGGGWLGQAWREHARWDARKAHRISDRVVAPLGIPLGAFLVFVLFVGGVSRVLLAVNEKASVAVALTVAVVVLAIFSVIALRPHVSTRVLGALVGVGAIVLVSAGAAGAAKGEREFENKNEPTTQEIELVAKNVSFDQSQLTVKAGKPFVIQFSNEDVGTYHNVGVYTAQTGGSPVADGQPVKGAKRINYTFTAPTSPGTYAFRCDFHANMVGTLTVQP
jgi:plastocyanin